MALGTIDSGIIANNLFAHQPLSELTQVQAIAFSQKIHNVNISSNIVYGLVNGKGLVLLDDFGGTDATGDVFQNNKIQIGADSGYTISTEYDPAGKWSFSGNSYYSDKSDGTRFNLAGVDKTDAQWATATGDDSTFEQVSFTDATRDVDTYMDHIGGTATIDGFIAAERAQGRYNWNPALEAGVINPWIRAGFGLSEYGVTPTTQKGRTSPGKGRNASGKGQWR
jgi:hypothetical protein